MPSSVVRSPRRMQCDCLLPRPTRPRSWWSCERPKRSACSTTIDRGVGHVDADFDDGGGDQHVDEVLAEALHDVLAGFAAHAAVEQADAERH